jgi:hypothetical protein
MNTRRFQIGSRVQVRNTFELKYGAQGLREIHKTACNVTGVIIGLKEFRLGNLNGSTYADLSDYETGGGQAWLNVTRTFKAWVVIRGMMNKAIYACDEDIDHLQLQQPNFILPIKFTNPLTFTERDRMRLSEESRSWPRDARGRWA